MNFGCAAISRSGRPARRLLVGVRRRDADRSAGAAMVSEREADEREVGAGEARRRARSTVKRLVVGPRMPPTSPPASTSEIAVRLKSAARHVRRGEAVVLAVGVVARRTPACRSTAARSSACQTAAGADQRADDAPQRAGGEAALPAHPLHVQRRRHGGERPAHHPAGHRQRGERLASARARGRPGR